MRSHIAEVASMADRWRGQLLELLFPARCVNCRQPGAAFCVNCRRQIQFVAPPLCPRCGHPLHHAHQVCLQCREHPLHLSQIRAVAYFDGGLREAIHGLKYNRRTELAAPLADLLQQYVAQTGREFDLITAVPLHPERQQRRGYNQAELLARELAQRAERPFVGGLTRVRATADQIGLDARARRMNVQDAFAADATAYRHRRVLLVDDVCTTGATLDACAMALAAQGAARVMGLTVARPPGRV